MCRRMFLLLEIIVIQCSIHIARLGDSIFHRVFSVFFIVRWSFWELCLAKLLRRKVVCGPSGRLDSLHGCSYSHEKWAMQAGIHVFWLTFQFSLSCFSFNECQNCVNILAPAPSRRLFQLIVMISTLFSGNTWIVHWKLGACWVNTVYSHSTFWILYENCYCSFLLETPCGLDEKQWNLCNISPNFFIISL